MSFDDIKSLALPATILAAGIYLVGTAFRTVQDLQNTNDNKTRWLPNYNKYVEGAAAGAVSIIGAGAIIYAGKVTSQN